MSDALTAKLDEIERRWSRRRMIHDKGTRSHGQPCKCSECREARIVLALVAALKAGLAVRAWDEESRERYDDTLKAIEELKL